MENIISTLDWGLFVLFVINILYVLVYSIGSHLRTKRHPEPEVKEYKRIAVLIPAYREDGVIEACVRSCLDQHYPADRFDVVVISDQMRSETNASLSALPIRLIEVHFKQSTKAKALNTAMNQLGDGYDIAVVLDADNLIPRGYLKEVNAKFATPGVEVVQTHRVGKNQNTRMALLDTLSEEINNSIFRLGHAKLGMSAALIGSGMAFGYGLFRDTMAGIKAVGGFDRELELKLLYHGKFFHYMPETHVFDEKIQSADAFSRQRRRWLSAQWHYCRVFSRYVFKAIAARRWDFCDKMFQQFSIPRLLLLGFTFIFAAFLTFIRLDMAWKWWGAFAAIVLALVLAVPRRLWGWKLLKAICKLPVSFLYMFLNLFRLRGANRKFLHTAHGVD